MDWTSAALWASLLAGLRAGTGDFALRPDRWPTRAPIPMVEAVLAAPLSGPAAVDALGSKLENAPGTAGLIRAAFETAGATPAPAAAFGTAAVSTDVPKELAAPLSRLVARLSAANADLQKAVASLSPEDRVRALRAADDALGDDPFLRPDGADFDAALRFDRPRLAAAAIAAAQAADEFARTKPGPGPAFSARWETDFGTVLVSSGDAELGAEDLARAGLIVRLGGRTRYVGPAAAAGEGQLRAVLDLGGPVVLESTGPAAGSGVFGIGLFYALGPGSKTLTAGEDSLGAARFGAGAAVIAGDGATLVSRRFGQGAAAFGAAVLETRGDKLALKLPLAGQGYATTLGAGFWRHRGDGLSAACGFEYPDAREPLGSVSMGQGAGMGPRAYAAGGVGAAFVAGDDAALSGSYFAQGAGYWHGLGALYVRGARARLQSRRYGLGTGTHMAVGALDVRGSSASVTGWGAGPAMGWDYGVGLFRLRGDDARVRADWGTGRADVGGRALAWIEGDRARLMLSGFGTGSFARAQAGYGLAVVKGADVRIRGQAKAKGNGDVRTSPWGVIRTDAMFDPDLTLPDPVWPPTDPTPRAAQEAGKTAALLSPPANEDARARVARLLFSASAAILDPRPAEGGAVGLIQLAPEDAPALASLLDPERFDELTWARVAAASLGPAAAAAAKTELPAATGVRRALLLDWARLGRAADALPAIEPFLRDADWRARRSAAGAIGGLFSADRGDEPGRRRLLRAGAAATPDAVALKRLPDLYAALALAGTPTAAERLDLLAKARTPFDSVAADAIADFAARISSSPARAAALSDEEKDLAALLDRARADLRAAAADPDDEVAAAALDGLGGMGLAEDAPLLTSALSAFSAQRREAAAWGLSRLGPAARPALERALKSADARVRAYAALAAARSWDQGTFELAGAALADADPAVRAAAVAGLSAAQRTADKTALLPRLRKLAAADAAAALAAAQIAP